MDFFTYVGTHRHAIAQAMEALKFYADKNNYALFSDKPDLTTKNIAIYDEGPIWQDGGELARKALGGGG